LFPYLLWRLGASGDPVRLAAQLRERLVVREVAEQPDGDERSDEAREDDPREEDERQPDA
jgi:hypothetical protein